MQIRKLNFTLEGPEITEWIEGNPFKTQLFNAISMSFPFGESYFIKSFKQLLNAGLIKNPLLLEKIRLFSAQEALHSAIHLEFNNYLLKKGLPFTLGRWFEARRNFCDKIFSIRTQLAVTMAYEHVTAALSHANLKYGWVNDVRDPNIKRMWNWHSAEEIEHSSVAYELYQEVNGGYAMRLFGMAFTLASFSFDYSVQTIINLWKTGNLFKSKTFLGAISFLFGRQGMFWIMTGMLFSYLSPKWKPTEVANEYATEWIKTHQDEFRVIKQ